MKFYACTVFAAACLVLSIASGQAHNTTCDRQCLEDVVSQYLTALTAHDPSTLPTTADVKYVENSQILPLGTGEWNVAGALGKYRHVFADPKSRQVAAITTMTENGVGLIYVVRLKIEGDRSISEIETQITRDPLGYATYENMTEPEAVWLQTVPPEQRISREKLIAQTDKYYTGMQRNDPRGNYSFFDRDCNRLEDGRQTTNLRNGDPYGHSNDTAFASLGCEAQFRTGFLGFVTLIRDRRYPVVDEERQAVFAITILDHNGTVRELPSVNGTSSPIPPYFDVPRTLAASEAFRLRGEKLFRIEMTLTEVPYGMRTAFVTSPPDTDDEAGTNRTTSDPCNRQCLEDNLEKVLQAMTANSSSSLPLAKGVRYSENGQFLSLGDGLWQTLAEFSKSNVDDYAARFANASTGTAAYWGLIREYSTPGVLALRVQIDNGLITEIEAIAIRAEASGAGGGTKTLMRPPLGVEWEGTSLGKLDAVFLGNSSSHTPIPGGLVDAYFNGLQQHLGLNVPFAPSCTRRDNGHKVSMSCLDQANGDSDYPNGLPEYISTVRDRRVLVTDDIKGVVIAAAMVDYPATSPGPLRATENMPGTYMILQLIKVDNAVISLVEGMAKWMPFGYTSEWTEGLLKT
jgi:CBS domain-containing protein